MRSPLASRRGQWLAPLRALRHWPWRDTFATLRRQLREHHLGLTASSLTFTTLIALVPLTTMAFALFSAFPVFGNFQSALEKWFVQNLVPDHIARPVLAGLTQFAAKARRLSGVGLAMLGVTAIALMLTIDRALNEIWRVRTPRPIGQRVLVYWAALTLGPLALGVSLSVTSYALSASRGLVGTLPGGVALLLNLTELGLLVAAVAGLFHYVPNTQVRWRHALAGGLFVTLGFELAKALLGLYLRLVPTYSAIYGAYATLPIFLIWLHLGWLIVLAGAVIAANAPRLSMHADARPVLAGDRFALSLSLLCELAAARQGPGRGLSLPLLAQRLRIDPLQIEPALDALIAIDWVARLEEAGEARHVLLCDPQATAAATLIDALLLERQPAARAFRERAGLDRMRLADLLA